MLSYEPGLKNFNQNLILTCNMLACLKPCFSIVAACWAGYFAKRLLLET